MKKNYLKKTFYSILVKSKGFCPHEISGSLQQAITVTQVGALTFISKECYFHYIIIDYIIIDYINYIIIDYIIYIIYIYKLYNMSGLIMTEYNIYGIENPPRPPPTGNITGKHQNISTAGVSWGYFVDLSNAVAYIDRDVSFNDLCVKGNLTVIGNTTKSTTTIHSTNLDISDNIITLNSRIGNTEQDTTTGILMRRGAQDPSSAFMGWVENGEYFALGLTDNSGTTIDDTDIITEYGTLWIGDLSANNINLQGDISANDASFKDVSLNYLYVRNDISANDIYFSGKIYDKDGEFGTTVNIVKQTFMELLTQQPHKFNKQGDPLMTSAKIDISWNYNDIIPIHKDTTVIAKLAHLTGKQSSLPFIDTIHFDISSNDTLGWIEWTIQDISVNSDYNVNSFKTLEITKGDTTSTNQYIKTTLGKEGSENPFDIRVYGKNNSNNYPTVSVRALVFANLFFITASPPSIPIFDTAIANSASNQIKFKYKCLETENTDDTTPNEQSGAVIIGYDVSYNEIETRAYNTTLSTSSSQSVGSVSGKTEGVAFDITLSGLKPGTKYNYRVRAKNDLTTTYSAYSTNATAHSYFTRLPTSGGIGTTIDNNIAGSSKTNIIGTGTTGSQIYINISTTDTGKSITPNKTISQTFEITKPWTSTQESTTTGYGNGVNGSSGLVTLSVIVDGTTKQTVSYGGFATTPTTTGDTYFVNDISQSDIYPSGNNQNFRLKGIFQLNTITNATVSNKIGAAQATPHTLQYKYVRDTLVGGSNDTTPIHNIYVDDLTGIPEITYTKSTVEVTGVKYTMGIASVKTMEITINRTYTNGNSANGFIVGNGIVGKIGAISKTNFTAENKVIAAWGIDTTTPGSYTHIKTSTIYYNTTFTNGRNDALTETSVAHNLVGTNTGTSKNLSTTGGSYNSTILNHFYDGLSYSPNTATSSELNLTTAKIYQIDNISYLATNIASITSTPYVNHSTAVNDSTLLYIGGKFQGNKSFTYPDTTGLNYDGLISHTYNAGKVSYDLNGSNTGAIPDSGYKWIVFDIPKNGSNYKLYGTDCTVTKTDGINSINIKTPLSSLFSDTILSALFSTSAEAVAFVKATKNGTNIIVMATLQGPHASSTPWYNDGSGTVGWADLSNPGGDYNKYKCGVGQNSISVNIDALKDDLQLFIGVKNV